MHARINRWISEEDAFEVMDLLEIEPTNSRPNVAQYDGELLQSICIGASARQNMITPKTWTLVAVYKLLQLWLLQDIGTDDFSFTSITLNKHF